MSGEQARLMRDLVDHLTIGDQARGAFPLDAVLEDGSEFMLWQAVRVLRGGRYSFSTSLASGGKAREQVALPIVRAALAMADRKQAVWTPLLDDLERAGDWGALAEQHAGLPGPAERAEGLAGWIAQQTDEGEVERLLDFEAAAVRLVLARHLRVFPDRVVRALEQNRVTAEALIENERSGTVVRERASERAYAKWKKAAKIQVRHGRGLGTTRSDEMELLRSLAASEEGLADALRREMLDDLDRLGIDLCREIAQTVVRDDRCTRQDLERLLADRRHGVEREAVVHPNGGEDLFEWLLASHPDRAADVLLSLIRDPSERLVVDEDRLWLAIRLKGDARNAAIAIVRHPAATEAMWDHLVQNLERTDKSRLLEALSEMPRARASGVRAHLLRSRARGVMENLLEDATGQEFTTIFMQLLDLDRERALGVFDRRGVPPDATLPQDFLREMMTSGDRRRRMHAIAALGGGAPAGVPLGRREPAKSARAR